MKILLEYPYTQDWESGYIVTNPENRKTVILTRNKSKEKSSTSYARYLMSVHQGRYLDHDEQVDHIDEDKTNDNITNLQLLSKQENIRKNGKTKRKPLHHGTLTTYQYCKCDICKYGKKLYNSGKILEYQNFIKNQQ